MIELTAQRTPQGKLYDLGDNKRRLVRERRIIHHPDDFAAWRAGGTTSWSEVAPQWTLAAGEYKSSGTWYDVTIPADLSSITYTSKAGRGHVIATLDALGAKTSGFTKTPTLEARRTLNDCLWFKSIDADYDLCFILDPARLRIFKKLHKPTSARSNAWIVETRNADHLNVVFETIGHDNEDLAVNRDDGGALQQRAVKLAHQIDRLSGKTQRFTETWSGEVTKIDKVTRIRTLETDPVYPVWIDFDITEEVTIDKDDGRIFEENKWYASLIRIYDGVTTNHPAWRFQGISGINSGDTIDYAAINVEAYGGDNNYTWDADFHCHDVDDAPYWDSGDVVWDPTTTTANTSVTNFPPNNDPNAVVITSAVQEVIDRGGWASGQDIRVIARTTGAPSGADLRLARYGEAGGAPGQLVIDFTAAAGGPPKGSLALMGVGI